MAIGMSGPSSQNCGGSGASVSCIGPDVGGAADAGAAPVVGGPADAGAAAVVGDPVDAGVAPVVGDPADAGAAPVVGTDLSDLSKPFSFCFFDCLCFLNVVFVSAGKNSLV